MTELLETELPILSREARIAQTVVLVDGIARSGKAIIAPIIASFERVEMLRVEETIDLLGAIYQMGHISEDAAVLMLRMKTDISLYNGVIGRDTNFRLGDYSGVWKSNSPWQQIKRLKAPEGDEAVEAIKARRPIYQQTTHDQLLNFDIFFKAFGIDFRNIQMIRHPVDLIDSWNRRDWGSRYGIDPLAFSICIRYQDQDLPFYAKGWEDIYLSSSPTGRVIRMIEWVWDRNMQTYRSLDAAQQKLISFIPFEDFVERPFDFVEQLAAFLGSATTKRTKSALKKQNCPRNLIRDVSNKAQLINQNISQEETEIMQRLIEEYSALVSEIGSATA